MTYVKVDKDDIAELFCQKHLKKVDPFREDLKDLNYELNQHIKKLKHLENMLIVYQEQME